MKKIIYFYLLVFSCFLFAQVECVSVDSSVDLEAGGAECNDKALPSDRDVNIQEYAQVLTEEVGGGDVSLQPLQPASGAGAVK